MPPTRPLKVFLCHASADKPAVRKLYRYLKERKMDPWLDAENLLPGQNWQVEIPRALHSSDVIIICISNRSVDKEGYVQKEIKFALDKALEMPEGRIFLIPARLEECDLPHSLSTYHYVNLFEEDGYRRLLKSLRLRAEQIGAAKVSTQSEDVSLIETQTDETGGEDEDDTREAEEKAEREKMELEAREKLAREKAEFEKVEKEAVERVEREKIEIAAKEKLARENAEHEALAKAARERIEREAKEKQARENEEREKAEKIAYEKKVRDAAVSSPRVVKPKKPAGKLLSFAIGGFGLLMIVGTLVVVAVVIGNKFFATVEATPTPQPTKTVDLTQPLGIGSTMIGDKGQTLVYVPEGEFAMGSDNGDADEKPVHTIYLDAFWIDQTEVTNKHYRACVDAGVCEIPSTIDSYTHSNYYGNPEFDNYPVIYVNWDKANRYCEVWSGGDLPTEAQWEKAASWNDLTQEKYVYPWGNDFNGSSVNFCDKNCAIGDGDKTSDDGFADTSPVSNYTDGVSPYGAYDMVGNVWEWMNDWYSETYYHGSPSLNPVGPESGLERVLRGGSWFDNSVRSAERGADDPTNSDKSIGFRCSRLP